MSLAILGDATILDQPKLALFCSVKRPGKLILETYDLCQRLRDSGITVISGFHSPMEQECLRILLRSKNRVIWCLARGMLTKIPTELRKPVEENRFIIVTPFPDKLRHITAKTAMIRNRAVADMSAAVVAAHATPGSKMEIICRELLAAGKPLFFFRSPGQFRSHQDRCAHNKIFKRLASNSQLCKLNSRVKPNFNT